MYDVEADLVKGLSSHKDNTSFEQLTLTNENDRWLATSSLQKSIRRGNELQALKAAYVLNSFSPTHLWGRLKVIALEDVGLANLDIVMQTLWVAGKPAWRNKRYTDAFVLSYLIHHLCKSTKLSVLDGALYIADRHASYKELRMTYSGMNEAALINIFYDDKSNMVERVIACWYLAGTKRYPSTGLVEKKGNPALLIDIAQGLGCPAPVMELLKLSRSQEYFASLLPCLIKLEGSTTTAVVNECNEVIDYAGHWPVYAYDRHTRPGKKIFRQFLKSTPNVQRYLKAHLPKSNHADLISWAVFALEGRMLNKRLTFDGSEDILKQTIETWMQCDGMTPAIQNDFLDMVNDKMGRLNDFRKQATR